jgi:heme-degrading monooxygenase HmoA
MKKSLANKEPGLIIIWEFRVRRGKQREFEKVYGPDGEWAEFFSAGKGYLGTELICDQEVALRYATLDFWTSQAAYDLFKKKHRAEYSQMDKKCESLADREKLIGYFRKVGTPGLVAPRRTV